jgi:hypothetical protein
VGKVITRHQEFVKKIVQSSRVDTLVKSHFPLPWREVIKGREIITFCNCFHITLTPTLSPSREREVF